MASSHTQSMPSNDESISQSSSMRPLVEGLIRVLLKVERVPLSLTNRCLRLLRFDNSNYLTQHSKAIRLKLRDKVLRSREGANSADSLSKFDRECDALKRLSPRTMGAFMTIYEPLAFSYPMASTHPTILKSSIYEDHNSVTIASMPLHLAVEATLLPATLQTSFIPPSSAPTPSAVEGTDGFGGTAEWGLFWIRRDLELQALSDLLFVFQGINGKHIKYYPRSESYGIDQQMKAKIPAPVRDIILSLCEVGWLYEKISRYITKVHGSEAIGLIAQAFTFALQEELHDYYRLLAVLEQELHRLSSSKPDTGVEAVKSGSRDGAEASGTSGLTLLRLRAWMQEPLERLCLIARLVDGASVLSGGALASRIHGHGRHGDTVVASFVQRIMDHVCVPLYHTITRWILYGDLQDPYEEFFVGHHGGNARASHLTPNVWLDTYFLRHAMLPTFLPLSLALRILVIGKTINFIRLCIASLPKKQEKISILPNTEFKPRVPQPLSLKIQPSPIPVRSGSDPGSGEGDGMAEGDLSTWLLSSVGKGVEASLQGLRYGGGELELVEVVQKIGSLTDSRLMRIVEKRYYLSAHLLALKKYLLLGQGDFVTCLMDVIGPELRKEAFQLYRHNLTGMLEGALRASNAQYDPSYILDRIGVRLLEAVPGDTGWEVFSLDYKIDTPLNAVVHGDAISKYRIAFHMFWRLKRVEWSLSASWKQMMTFTHTRGDKILVHLRPVIHRCTLNRGRMVHVVNNLCAFVMFEVLETAWAKLQENMSRVKCLDDVIRYHDQYLEDILNRSLLSQPHEQLNLQIQQLLQSILRFCALEEALIADAMVAIARKRGGTAPKSSILEKAFVSTDTDSIDGVSMYVVSRLEDAAVDFNARFDDIMTTLKEQSEQATDLLRYLTFRLDFNEYHSSHSSLLSAQVGGPPSPFIQPIASFVK